MGLAQRRIVAGFQEKEFKAWKKEFDKIVGFPIKVDVKWDTLTRDTHDDAAKCAEYWTIVYFDTLNEVFKTLCQDDMGKSAVKESIKSIEIDGSDGSSYRASKFENGVLYFKHAPFTNVNDVKERSSGISKMLEEKL